MVSAPKDPNTAFLIELVGGLFGFLGLGYIWVGRTNDGVLRLAIWFIYSFVAWITIFLLSTVIIGCFCIPIQLIIQFGVSFFSANELKKSMPGGSPMAAFAPYSPTPQPGPAYPSAPVAYTPPEPMTPSSAPMAPVTPEPSAPPSMGAAYLPPEPTAPPSEPGASAPSEPSRPSQ